MFLLLIAFSLAAVPGGAGAADAAVCTFTVPVTFSPGLSATNGQGSFQSQLQAGQIRCVGTIGGAVNPQGTVHVSGWFGYDTPFGSESCEFGAGSIGLSYNIPADGPGYSGGGWYVRTGLVSTFGFRLGPNPPRGVFEIRPDSGQDCRTTPITSATFTGALRTY